SGKFPTLSNGSTWRSCPTQQAEPPQVTPSTAPRKPLVFGKRRVLFEALSWGTGQVMIVVPTFPRADNYQRSYHSWFSQLSSFAFKFAKAFSTKANTSNFCETSGSDRASSIIAFNFGLRAVRGDGSLLLK